MCKEVWIQSYEKAAEDIAEELDIEYDEAERILKERLDKDCYYLDGYLSYDAEQYEI